MINHHDKNNFFLQWQKHLIIFLLLLILIPSPGHAVDLPSPASVKSKALKAQSACFTKLSKELKKNEGGCGNNGCSWIIRGCYSNGEQVVLDAIDQLVEESSEHISEGCKTGIQDIANAAKNDNIWLDEFMYKLPVVLDGDPIIFFRLYFYEIIYKTVNHPDC